jgi:hypothetical protein
MTRFGYNVLKLDNLGRDRLWRHAAELPPGVMLFYNTEGESAWDFKRDFPEWDVIHRAWPDGDEWSKTSPTDWFKRHEHRGRDGVLIYTCNEPQFSNPLLDWHTELLKVSKNSPVSFVCLNLSPGHPEPAGWQYPASRRFLDEYNAQILRGHFVGLHEYGGAIMTSGISGDSPWRTDPQQWRTNLEGLPFRDGIPFRPAWHVGRWRFLHKACDEMGIATPQVIITETGIAELGDIDRWIKELPLTPGYVSHDGWKACRTVWQDWLNRAGLSFWSPERFYAEQLLWSLAVPWFGVYGACVFGWGDSGGWAAHDVSDAPVLQRLMEARLPLVEPPAPSPAPDKVVIEIPRSLIDQYHAVLSDLLSRLP